MAAFTTNMTSVGELDSSLVEAFDQQFIIASGEDQQLDQFAQIKKVSGAKSIDLTKYARLAVSTTPLVDKEDPVSEAMSDTLVTLTPAEYGNVITKTTLASFQTGGKVDAAAARLVGLNLGQVKNKLAVLALEASANNVTADGGAAASMDASDLITQALINRMYNRLSRANVAKLAEGNYVAVVHEDVAYDIRNLSGWTDVMKYASPQNILKNEIGMLGGFRFLVNNGVSIDADGGASAVDLYKTIFMGANALGLAESLAPEVRITGPFDKLARFVNCGWYGVMQYKIVDADCVWTLQSASSIGANV